MKKRLRSRVLALGMAGTTLLGSATLLLVQPARGQDKPSAAASLEQAKKNFALQHFKEAKAALDDIDAAQLPEDQRAAYNDLKAKVDAALAAAPAGNTTLESAKAAIEAKKYAEAVKLLNSITASPSASNELKAQANQQLAIATNAQKALAPKMKELLKDAETAVNENRLDDATNALATIEETGADLGWELNAKPAKLRAAIDAKRVAAANPGTTAGTGAAATTTTVVETTTTTTTTTPPVATGPSTGGPVVDAGTAGPTAGATTPPPAVNADDLLGQTLETDRIQKERAITLYRQRLEQSQTDAADGNLDRAVRDIEDAIALLDNAKQYFSDVEYRSLRDAASRQLTTANDRRLAADEARKRASDRDAAERDRARAELLKQTRQNRVKLLFRDANTFAQQQQYREAADTLRQILAIDPTNDLAKLTLRLVEDKLNYREWERLQTRKATEEMKHMVMNKEEEIPYADLLVYPEDWVELSRLRIGEQSNADSPANRATREKLEQPIREISAENQGFEKVINFVRDNAGINIFVNWKALEGTVDRNTPVSVNLRDVPIRKALTTILSEVGNAQTALGYTIDEGVVTISTKDDLNARYQVIRVYDIRDLTLPPNQNIQIPQLGLGTSTTVSGSGGTGGIGGGGGGGGGLFGGGTGGTTGGTTGVDTAAYQKAVDDIINTVAQTVDPNSWKTIGNNPGTGTIGSIRELNGQLVVNQTIDNQIAVYNLLQQLRETRTIQISIESRLVLVGNNFLDDFGFGWSLTLPYGTLGNSVAGPGGPGTPITISNNTAGMAVPAGTGIPGTLGGQFGGASAPSSLSLGGTILDNWQLSVLLRATQADKRTTNVTAPRVTLFNGEQANLFVGSQTNYVRSFNQNTSSGGITGNGAVGTTPEVAQLNTGVNLSVTATVSADRRYVLMNITPNLASLDGIDTYTGSGTATQTASQPGGGGGASSQPIALGGSFIQVPRVSVTQVVTRVSIPDGGTLLIGGQKLVGEAEIEVGVPVLSKIPGLNRLFTNRTFVRDERTLLILVRPRIIIQREEETKLFGPDYDKPSNLPRLEGGAGGLNRMGNSSAGGVISPTGTGR